MSTKREEFFSRVFSKETEKRVCNTELGVHFKIFHHPLVLIDWSFSLIWCKYPLPVAQIVFGRVSSRHERGHFLYNDHCSFRPVQES